MKITIPELSLIILIGASGSGKSTFARKHFQPFEIISSDFCRGLVSNNENSQSATKDAFEVLRFIAEKRLAAAKLTVIDATNVQMEDRKPLLQMARQYHCFAIAIVLDLPEELCIVLRSPLFSTYQKNYATNVTNKGAIVNLVPM